MNLEKLQNYKIGSVASRGGKYNYDEIQVSGFNEKTSDRIIGNITEATRKLRQKVDVKLVTPSSIYKSAAGYRPKVQGYKWKFVDEMTERKHHIFMNDDAAKEFLSIGDNSKQLIMFDLSGNFIKAFDNVLEAMKYLKTSDNKSSDYVSIINLARGTLKKVKTAYGYQWKFYDDLNL